MYSYYLAVDLGASSGRTILGHVNSDIIELEEINRFENTLVERNGHLCWDLDHLFECIVEGLSICKERGRIPTTLGIDTWGVDFVLLGESNQVLGDTVAYRDSRTHGMKELVDKILPFGELYSRTGIQFETFNSIYQLMAIKQTSHELLARAKRFLMVPEYLNYKLTGVMQNEYTNATTTSLVSAHGKNWDYELIQRLGLPTSIFSELAMPGTDIGCLSGKIAERVGFNCRVVLPASHDTGSAYLAVPARDDTSIYISSGTWSLLGVERPMPLTSRESMLANFTNEGGFNYRFRYLRNIMGLWMLQSVRRELGKPSFDDMERAAVESNFDSRVDANDEVFLAPESMIKALQNYCASHGQAVPQTMGELTRCVYFSLAHAYREAIAGLSELTGTQYTAVNIVGGGSKDSYLNQLTAQITGLPVLAGPTEGTALGNLIVQFIAAGEFPDLRAARASIKNSFDITEVSP